MLSAMSQEHERGAGGWQTEWTVIPDAFRHTMRAAVHLRSAVASLDVYTDRMRMHLDDASGALMAESLATTLAPHVGRPEAMRLTSELVERAFRDRISLQEAARLDTRVSGVLTSGELIRAFDAASYLGGTQELIDRALRSWRDMRQADAV